MAIFNSDRYGFCILGGKCVVMDPEDRKMETRDWMYDRLHLTDEATDYVIRGYFLPGRIQFFTGDGYNASEDVDAAIIADAVATYARLYDIDITDAFKANICNGVWPGDNGETWPPVLRYNQNDGRWEVAK